MATFRFWLCKTARYDAHSLAWDRPQSVCSPLASLRSKCLVQDTGDCLVPVASSACDAGLNLFGRSRSYFLCASHMRSRLWVVKLLGLCRLLQGGDHLTRTSARLEIVLLVNPSTLRCDGV